MNKVYNWWFCSGGYFSHGFKIFIGIEIIATLLKMNSIFIYSSLKLEITGYLIEAANMIIIGIFTILLYWRNERQKKQRKN